MKLRTPPLFAWLYLGIGVFYITFPARFYNGAPYRQAQMFAPMWVYGIAFLVVAVLITARTQTHTLAKLAVDSIALPALWCGLFAWSFFTTRHAHSPSPPTTMLIWASITIRHWRMTARGLDE